MLIYLSKTIFAKTSMVIINVQSLLLVLLVLVFQFVNSMNLMNEFQYDI